MSEWITIKPGDPPPSCQHYRIDNENGQCVACGEQMVARTVEAKTVLSAPNAAPCRDPNHLAAMERGEDFECSHPYVPDVRRQKTVVIGYDVTYECGRCGNNGTRFESGREPVWDCGHAHRGDRVPVDSTSA
jgi:hypothetical protein